MKKIALLMLTAILGLQGCNSSTDTSKKPEFVAVHQIDPSQVADYVADFKSNSLRLKLVFDNVESKINHIQNDNDSNSMILKYDKGLAVIGFDFDEDEPLPLLRLLEGDTSDLENFEETRTLTGSDIVIDDDDGTIIYSGMVRDEATGDIYPVSLQVNEALIGAGDSQLIINEKNAILSGTLGTSTYIQIQDMLNTTSVNTLILSNINGSDNDAINMHTGRLIRNAGLMTLMPKDGEAYSGGVDLFAAGVLRIYQEGGKIGVHSWCCTDDGKDAGQLSKDDKAHGAQLTYFREMLGDVKGPEFYFYTINAAPASGIHLMSVADMVKYTLTTP